MAISNVNQWTGFKWIVFYTHPRAEKQAQQNLARAGIECYLPLVRERHQWSDRMQWVECPLIPSYIFARISDRELARVKAMQSIAFPVTQGKSSRVAEMSEQQMADFRQLVEHAQHVRVIEAGVFRKGTTVEVLSGDFKGLQGRLVSQEGENFFGVELEGVSLAVVTTIDAKLLKVIES